VLKIEEFGDVFMASGFANRGQENVVFSVGCDSTELLIGVELTDLGLDLIRHLQVFGLSTLLYMYGRVCQSVLDLPGKRAL
jgi:hypothetical protein